MLTRSLTQEWQTAGYIPMDLELTLFLSRHARTPLQWDILAFFALNPHTRDTAAALAERLGRQTPAVARELEDMALLGILEKQADASMAVYGLRREPGIMRLMERLRRHLETMGKPSRPGRSDLSAPSRM